MEKNTTKKIVFLLAPNDFRDEEYFQPKVIIQSKSIEVHTAVIEDPEEVTGTQGGKARPDVVFAELKADDYDGIVLVGGKGCKVYFDNEFVLQLVRDFNEQGKVVSAICSASAIPAKAGILKGIKATGFEDEKEIIVNEGAVWSDNDIEKVNNIVTARDAEVALQFGSTIVEALS